MDAQLRSSNVLLSRLPEREFERLAPALEPISVARREVIGQPGGFIEFVHFPLTAVAAVSVPLADGAQPAVATIGHEGLVGLPVLLGDERSPHLVSWCLPGNALRIRSVDLLAATTPFSQLAQDLAAYAETRMVAMAQNMTCAIRHDIRERSARWLLTLSDKAATDRLDLTHEDLALMLGVSRQSVSLALESLAVDQLIAFHSGHLLILSRSGLESAACECYASLRSEWQRAFGRGSHVA